MGVDLTVGRPVCNGEITPGVIAGTGRSSLETRCRMQTMERIESSTGLKGFVAFGLRSPSLCRTKLQAHVSDLIV